MAADSSSVDAALADALSKLDAMNKRMDALEVGEKNIMKGDAAKKADDDDDDDRKKDSTKKADGTVPKKVIKDSRKSDAKKADDDDDKRKDSAKKSDDDDDDRRDDDDDDDRRDDEDPDKETKDDDDDDDRKKDSTKKADTGRKDAFPPPKKDRRDDDRKKDRKDDDGELEIKHAPKDDAAKADSVGDLRKQIADQAATIRRLEAFMKPRTDDEHAAFADAQARADSVFIAFGQRAPRPMEGEEVGDYKRRLASKLKTHSAAWKNMKLSKLPDEAFDIAESQIYSDAAAAARNPTDIAVGELRMVSRQDPDTGLRTNFFYGPESFVKKMGRAGRKVQSFRTNPQS